MTKMQAVRMHGYGDPDVLSLETADLPAIGDNDILVRQAATSVNPFDAVMRAGYLAQVMPMTFPAILGTDISGTVEAVGSAVTEFSVGDEVWARGGMFRDGAYAELVAVAASEAAARPSSLDAVTAAALPHAALAAWQALIGLAELSQGQTVLIHGAAGGVGHIAVHLAKWRGANVIATTSQNSAFVESLGADTVVDYTTTRFEDIAAGVDCVLDTVGGETQERSWATLAVGGIMVSLLQPPSPEAAAEHRARTGYIDSYPVAGPILAELAGLVDQNVVTPHVSARLALSEAAEAHRMIEGRHTRGKIVLEMV